MTPVHFSSLKLMAISPKHCLHAMHAERDATPQEPWRRNGSLVDALMFGHKPFAVWSGTRRGKEWERFAADNDDRLIVTSTEADKAHCQAEALRARPDAMALLDGQHQREVEWNYQNSRACHSTLDVWKPGAHITELKTARTVHPDRLMWAARRYAYHAQLEFYAMAAGEQHHDLYIVAVESAPPWDVTILRLGERIREHARLQIHSWMTRLRSCEESGEWPGQAQGIVEWDDEDSVGDLMFDTDAEEAVVTQ